MIDIYKVAVIEAVLRDTVLEEELTDEILDARNQIHARYSELKGPLDIMTAMRTARCEWLSEYLGLNGIPGRQTCET